MVMLRRTDSSRTDILNVPPLLQEQKLFFGDDDEELTAGFHCVIRPENSLTAYKLTGLFCLFVCPAVCLSVCLSLLHTYTDTETEGISWHVRGRHYQDKKNPLKT